MHRRRLVLAAVVLLAACGGGAEPERRSQSFDETKPMLVPDGPLRGVLVSTDAPGSAGGRVSRAKLPSTATRVYAVVPVGPDVRDGATVTVVWFRLAASGRQRLFSHAVDARAGGGRVIAQAVAPRGLARGIYETAAFADGHQVRTPWLVGADASGTRRTSSVTEPQPGAPDAAAGPISWESSDDADWGDDPNARYTDDWDAPLPPAGPCAPRGVSAIAGLLTLEGMLRWTGDDCTSVELAAAVRGAPRTYAALTDPPPSIGTETLTMSEHLCALPGGSDLPGTVVQVVGTANGRQERLSFTLEDDAERFGVELESTPAPGSRVEIGDEINLRAMAADLPPSLGIKLLYVDDGNDLLGTARSIGGATTPRACDFLRFIAVLGDWPSPEGPSRLPPLRYRVPEDAPPVLEICAYGESFDGKQGSACASYYTGEVWEGTWDAGFHVPAPCTPSVWPQVGTLTATVAPDGSLSGRGDLVNHTGVCGGVDVPQQVPVMPLFTGARTDDEIRLEIQLPGLGSRVVQMPRSGNVAEGTLTVPLGGGSRWEIRARLECTTC